jgi:hypothetical protein
MSSRPIIMPPKRHELADRWAQQREIRAEQPAIERSGAQRAAGERRAGRLDR